MDLKSLIRNKLLPQKFNVDSLTNLDPTNRSVEVELSPNDYITFDKAFVYCSPPRLIHAIKNPEMVKPIGLIVNATIQSEKAFISWEELNSDEERYIPLRTKNVIQISRILSNHNSLIYALYRWAIAGLLTFEKQQNSALGLSEVLPFNTQPGYVTHQSNVTYGPDSAQAYNNNRANRHFNNLHSEFTEMPFGLLFVELDGFNNVINAYFGENCQMRTSFKTISSENPLIIENVNILCPKIKPGNGLRIMSTPKKPFNFATRRDEITGKLVSVG